MWISSSTVYIAAAMIAVSNANVEFSQSTDCDLGTVAEGEAVACRISVIATDPNPSGEGASTTVSNTFNLVDSSGASSFCESPTITFDYLNNDFASSSEYIDLFEGSTTSSATITRCSSGQDGACDIRMCVTDRALSGDYSESSSIAITVFASGAVDGVHWGGGADVCPGYDGNQVYSNLTLTCTRGLNCEDTACQDGDYCNGEEYCLDGECTSGVAVECSANFVCSSDQQRCVRECETFAIDGYLRDCSEEFDEAKTDIASVIDQATDNLESIEALQPVVSANTVGLATVTANVDEINTVIGGERADWASSDTILDQLAALNARMDDVDSLLTRMDAVEARLDAIEERLFGYEPQVAEGENTDNSFTAPDGSSSTPSTPFMTVNGHSVNWIASLVGVTILLLVLNVVLMINNFCCGKHRKSRKQYAVVYQDSSDEQFERARLNRK